MISINKKELICLTTERIRTGKRTQMDSKHGKYMVVLYTKPEDCGGKCLYCIKTSDITNATIPNEDTLLAKSTAWSSAKQLIYRCEDAGIKLHTGNKFELRIKGNSFTNYDAVYLEHFIKDVYDLLNGCTSDTFEEAFRMQEFAKDKCVQIVVETRADMITHEWCQRMLRWGVRTVEIGVQSLSDSVLDTNLRGHRVDAIRDATKLIRHYGFELGYHVMIGLYGSSRKNDCDMLSRQLWSSEYYPDSLKIYPCLLLHDEAAQKPLYTLLHSGRWHPIQDAEYDSMLREVLPNIPADVHVNRLQRILNPSDIAYGVKDNIDRQKYRDICHSMWQRSVQNVPSVYMSREPYRLTSYLHDDELCVQAVTKDNTILGYGRLSLRSNDAIIRDLRVLGKPLNVGQKPSDSPDEFQHQGIGKAMLSFMEQFAAQRRKETIRVNSSAGCVGYFRKNGYRNETDYSLSKHFDNMKGGYYD